MSLDVSPALLEKAQTGDISENEFLVCIQASLPYAWQLIADLVRQLRFSEEQFVDNQTPPPNEQARGQLLRVLASDAMRHALEQHYGVKLAFQNCHRVALFRKDQLDATYEEFISPRSQILNQSPELRDC
ncbi:MAG TPA: SCO5389 family protein [Ktedonobacteraceae bacterium]